MTTPVGASIMKDITTYFQSPTKSPLNTQTSPKVVEPRSTENASEKHEAPPTTDKSKPNKKNKKTKKKRKPTDPEVRNVAELFSTSLNIVSPNTSECGSEPNSQKPEGDSNAEAVKLTPKVNAFDFLMNSRNNVIGSNSEGKQLEEADCTPTEDKSKLKARKKLLENWAQDKGSTKRKREEEEEIDKVISVKLKKRAKRLKKLLHVEDSQDSNLHTKTKKPRKISSSESEASNDFIDLTSSKEESLEPLVVIEENTQDVVITGSLTPKKKLKENNLLNFLGVVNQIEKEQVIEVYDEPDTQTKEIIKIKMFTPKGQSKRVSRISERLPSLEKNDSKLKHKHTKRKKLENETKNSLNDSLEDFCPLSSTKKSATENKSNKKLNETEKNKVQNEETCIITEGRSLRKRSAVDYRQIFKYTETPKSPKTKSKQEKGKMKKPTTKKKKDEQIEKIDLLSSDDSEESKSSSKVTKKVAPVFLKATPKPKESAEVVEARQKFLMSGIPDSLKKTVEKQKKIEEKDVEIFPTISHIQQKCASTFWDLSKPVLPFASLSQSYQFSTPNCKSLIVKTTPYEVNLTTKVEKIKHLKTLLHTIKNQNPHYPVYKVFRHVYEKSGKSCSKSPGKGKKRGSRNDRESVKNAEEMASKDQETWCEKYKPRSSQEIFGNHQGVQELRTWLETWKKYSQEINAKAKSRKGWNSESEFESTDCDSRDSTWLPGNTMVLYGPTGTGKTSAVYAIAKELKFNVLELNASTKRTGKKLLQELQEATQSHQVRKSDTMSKFTQTSSEPKNKNKKMCILLLEDIDLIFDQDEGFLSSLSQLIVTSKRPIILTTTDKTPSHVQKFISQYECTIFQPLSMHCLAVWLQIVCLVEGLLVDKDHLGNLLEYNKGDIRRTLLQVQFWCQSGGQIEPKRELPVLVDESDVLQCTDEDLQLGGLSEDETSALPQTVHKNLVGSFEVFRVNRNYSIPERTDLGLLWWNMPSVVNSVVTTPDQKNSTKLLALSKLYDSLSVGDYLVHNTTSATSEPVVKSWTTNLLDSIELTERKVDRHWSDVDLTAEMAHALLNGHIEHYTDKCRLNLALPDSTQRIWRANQHLCDNYLRRVVSTSSALERSSVAMDYFPALRDFLRSEERRAASNTKRGNRFRHYFREFNLDFKPTICKKACDILNIDNRI